MSAFERIPAELRERAFWVVWRWGDVDPKTGKRKKTPYCPSDPGRHGSSTNPETWATFEQAVAVVEAGEADGIGFALQPPWVGVDLDEELPETDRYAIALALNSYTEESVSGTGLHVIVRAHLNGGRHPQGFGVFQEGRLWYCSGEHVTGTPTTIEERQDELEAVLAEYLPKSQNDLRDRSVRSAPVDLDDQELLERAFAARNGEKFRRLWEGDWSGYPSQSEADLALATHLAFWTDRDAPRIDALFRSSGLMRDKWERGDYRERTIEAAIAAISEGYQPHAGKPVPGSERVTERVSGTPSPPVRDGGVTEPVPPVPSVRGTGSGTEPVSRPSASSVELVFQSAAEFAAEDEPTAEMVLGFDEDDAAFTAEGTVIVFGKGGGGKTTLTADITWHLATGTDWQGLRVPRRRKVVVIEHDGPRGRFRRKVRAKHAAWKGGGGDDPGDHLTFLAKPWAQLKLSNAEHRAALGAYINTNGVEVLVAGPIVSLGMIGGGTPDEVAAFEAHLQALRDLLERPLLVVLIHHTNQKGQISGAWDRVPDTLMLVVNTGKSTRLVWQKARDSSTLHAASWKLRWAEGMAFELDDTPEQTEEDIEEAILAAVLKNPGTPWTPVRKSVKGNGTTLMAVRDRLIDEGRLLNKGKGQAFALWHPDDVEESSEGERHADEEFLF